MYRIVVIDDEYIVVEGIKAMIKRAGLDYEVVGAAYDGISGLEVIREKKPDIVITDIRIPGMDGLSLIEELKEYLAETIFIVISGYMEFEYARRALSLGVRGYIDKPITIEKIKEILDRVIKEDEEAGQKSRENEKKQIIRREYGAKLQELIDFTIGGDPEMFKNTAKELLSLLHFYSDTAEKYRNESFEFLCVVSGIFQEHFKEYDAKYTPSYTKMEEMNTILQMEQYTEKIIHRISENMEARKPGSSHRTIIKILEYINENYHKDIGLNEISDMVKMNPAYLSMLFKDEVGTTYIKYLTSLRMKRAKELLKEGHKVLEVSERVGYSNYRYFCDIFKKNVGQTPNEFKGNVRRK